MILIKDFKRISGLLDHLFFLVCVFNLLRWVIDNSHSEQRNVCYIFLLLSFASIFSIILFLCSLAKDDAQACL